jgi:hypothetical protein
MTETRKEYQSTKMDAACGEDYLRKVTAFHEHMMADPDFRRTYEAWLTDLDKLNGGE